MKEVNMKLHFPAPELKTGYNPICDPGNSALRWLSFGRLWLPKRGDHWQHTTGGQEQVLSLFHGSGSVEVEGGPVYTIGTRRDPFSAPPTFVYLPAGCKYRVSAGADGLDAGVSAADALPGGQPLLIPPEQAVQTQHGAGRWARKVNLGTTLDFPIQRLMVGETFNRPGGWTSFPPHKHDEINPPGELPYEEIYFFIFKPAAGFAMQRVYDLPSRKDALDVAMVVKNGDTVAIPRGHHPVAGAPGYQMYYLWVMCGDVGNRTYGQTTVDPAYQWLLPVEPLLD